MSTKHDYGVIADLRNLRQDIILGQDVYIRLSLEQIDFLLEVLENEKEKTTCECIALRKRIDELESESKVFRNRNRWNR